MVTRCYFVQLKESVVKKCIFYEMPCTESDAAIKMMDNCNRDVILTSFLMVTRWFPDVVNDTQFLKLP